MDFESTQRRSDWSNYNTVMEWTSWDGFWEENAPKADEMLTRWDGLDEVGLKVLRDWDEDFKRFAEKVGNELYYVLNNWPLYRIIFKSAAEVDSGRKGHKPLDICWRDITAADGFYYQLKESPVGSVIGQKGDVSVLEEEFYLKLAESLGSQEKALGRDVNSIATSIIHLVGVFGAYDFLRHDTEWSHVELRKAWSEFCSWLSESSTRMLQFVEFYKEALVTLNGKSVNARAWPSVRAIVLRWCSESSMDWTTSIDASIEMRLFRQKLNDRVQAHVDGVSLSYFSGNPRPKAKSVIADLQTQSLSYLSKDDYDTIVKEESAEVQGLFERCGLVIVCSPDSFAPKYFAGVE